MIDFLLFFTVMVCCGDAWGWTFWLLCNKNRWRGGRRIVHSLFAEVPSLVSFVIACLHWATNWVYTHLHWRDDSGLQNLQTINMAPHNMHHMGLWMRDPPSSGWVFYRLETQKPHCRGSWYSMAMGTAESKRAPKNIHSPRGAPLGNRPVGCFWNTPSTE